MWGRKRFFLIMLTIVISALGVSRFHYLKATMWRERSLLATERLEQQKNALKLALNQQREVAMLDEYHVEKLHEAINENTDLRAKLASGTYRMHVSSSIKPTCSTAFPSSVGHATAIELSGETGQDIFSIREGIIRDQQKIIYLQDYINRVCIRNSHGEQ